jgi:uncharacterized membrane protein
MLLYLTNLAAIVLCASGVFVALGLRPKMPENGYSIRVGVGAIIILAVVAFITLHLGRQTIARFQEARDEELVIVAVNEWIGPHPVEIQRIDVARDTVEIGLIFDAPLHFAYVDEQQAPSKMLSEELDEHILFQKMHEILGRPVTTVFRGQFRYIAIVQPPPNKVE